MHDEDGVKSSDIARKPTHVQYTTLMVYQRLKLEYKGYIEDAFAFLSREMTALQMRAARAADVDPRIAYQIITVSVQSVGLALAFLK